MAPNDNHFARKSNAIIAIIVILKKKINLLNFLQKNAPNDNLFCKKNNAIIAIIIISRKNKFER
jgi:hypothetical protein